MEARLRNEQNTVLSEVKTALATLDAKFVQFDAKLEKVDRDIFRTNAVVVSILGIIVVTQPKLLEMFSFIASILKFSV